MNKRGPLNVYPIFYYFVQFWIEGWKGHLVINKLPFAYRKKLYSDQLYMELTNLPENFSSIGDPSNSRYGRENASLIFTIVSFRNLTRFLPKVYFSRNRWAWIFYNSTEAPRQRREAECVNNWVLRKRMSLIVWYSFVIWVASERGRSL